MNHNMDDMNTNEDTSYRNQYFLWYNYKVIALRSFSTQTDGAKPRV